MLYNSFKKHNPSHLPKNIPLAPIMPAAPDEVVSKRTATARSKRTNACSLAPDALFLDFIEGFLGGVFEGACFVVFHFFERGEGFAGVGA
jgi:hypothetical protein